MVILNKYYKKGFNRFFVRLPEGAFDLSDNDKDISHNMNDNEKHFTPPYPNR